MPTSTVLITGAASGIGRAAATRFAATGWRCILVDRNVGALERLRLELGAAEVRSAGARQHETCGIDLADPIQIRSLAGLPGPIDAVINNAGMSDTSGTPLTGQHSTSPPRRRSSPRSTICWRRGHASSTSHRARACARYRSGGSTAPPRPG
jgi:NAD(P)-dependent dehydrogenase (short-subunit alcohol dehydrogenase family)